MNSIYDLFNDEKHALDRPIERVIDYYATDEHRLAREIDEYEVTDQIELRLRKFLDVFESGVTRNQVTDTGVWVSGFYGSGKSSLTKYLGFALEGDRRMVNGMPFVDRLAEKINDLGVRQQLRVVAQRQRTAVVMLDLATDMLAKSAIAPVSTVLEAKVQQITGFSIERKLAWLERELRANGQYEAFRAAYEGAYPGKGSWEHIHNDGMLGVARAAKLAPQFFPGEFPTPADFSAHELEDNRTVRQVAEELIGLIHQKFGAENILIFIDEAGQYVARRSELILNLQGLATSLKELGKGKVWLVVTGQQTLSEIIESSAYNSVELNRLKDRFPITLELDPRDIREITYRRLLTKREIGRTHLADLFARKGPATAGFTRLIDAKMISSDELTADSFTRYYPFLPHHFDLLMQLIRVLARQTGGIGLRSVIRVVQDVLVDASRVLPPSQLPLARRSVGVLACVDDFFDTLRSDIRKDFTTAVEGVERVEKIFYNDPLVIRAAKAIAALQPLEDFPRSAENIAALLYQQVGAESPLEPVTAALRRLVDEPECGVVFDPQSRGYLFLSEATKQYRDKRNRYVPTSGELAQLRSALLKRVFEPLPTVMLDNIKNVKAGIRFRQATVVGEGEDIYLRIEPCRPQEWETARLDFQQTTTSGRDWDNVIVWLTIFPDDLERLLAEAIRSDRILHAITPNESDKELAKFLRAERRQLDLYKDEAKKLIEKNLFEQGLFIYKGVPKPVAQGGFTFEIAVREMLAQAARRLFPHLALVSIRPATDLAERFLATDRLDRIVGNLERDPLGLIRKRGASKATVDPQHPALAQTLSAFRRMVEEFGSGRITGKQIQDAFSAPPYGWTKDAVRYLFAALFSAGEIQLHTAEGTLTTPGPKSIEAFKSTVSFNRAGISLRDSRPPLEALDRAAQRLEKLFAVEVLPLEEHISRAVLAHFPGIIESIGSLPDRLRLLQLLGAERARGLLEACTDLLKEDAGGAAMLLGANTSSIPDDIAWAKAVVAYLKNGGENDVRNARLLIDGLRSLEKLFPETRGLLCGETGETDPLSSVLGSGHFYEHQSDLRAGLRTVEGRIENRLRTECDALSAALTETKANLGTLAGWENVTAEDRNTIWDRLEALRVTAEASPGEQLDQLRLVLVRRSSLAGELEKLRAFLLPRLQPLLVPDLEDSSDGDGQLAPVTPVTIALQELLPARAIETRAQLDTWLDGLRVRIQTILDGGGRAIFARPPGSGGGL